MYPVVLLRPTDSNEQRATLRWTSRLGEAKGLGHEEREPDVSVGSAQKRILLVLICMIISNHWL